MSSKPWEGRTVWCQGERGSKGWIEIQEAGTEDMRLIVRLDSGLVTTVCMTREQAKTFAAQIMNLAVRNRS